MFPSTDGEEQVICIDSNKLFALQELKDALRVAVAKGCCKNITREEGTSID